jgi:hypothetical protein
MIEEIAWRWSWPMHKFVSHPHGTLRVFLKQPASVLLATMRSFRPLAAILHQQIRHGPTLFCASIDAFGRRSLSIYCQVHAARYYGCYRAYFYEMGQRNNFPNASLSSNASGRFLRRLWKVTRFGCEHISFCHHFGSTAVFFILVTPSTPLPAAMSEIRASRTEYNERFVHGPPPRKLQRYPPHFYIVRPARSILLACFAPSYTHAASSDKPTKRSPHMIDNHNHHRSHRHS